MDKKEKNRLEALRNLQILDTPAEDHYDNITSLAAYICDVPMALITLVDENRQWFKSKVGIDICQTPREISFCTHAIKTPNQLTEVEDARLDDRFKDNPMVKAKENPIIFYVGYPLKDEKGNALGTLCLVDYKPRKLTDGQRKALITLGKQVESLFELRKKNFELEVSEKELSQHNRLLKNFAGAVSHDLKMPLASIIMTIDVLKSKYKNVLDEQAYDYFDRLKQSSLGMSDYITNILGYYETDNISSEDYCEESFGLLEFLESIIDMLNIEGDCEINLPEKDRELICNRSALEQIFINLLGNSLKYNDKDKMVIDIEAEEKKGFYYFKISDNGMGIPANEIEHIFDLFTIAVQRDRHGKKGSGIGLSTVQKIVRKLEGDISVDSEEGKYTTFKFSIKKQKLKKESEPEKIKEKAS